MKILIIASLTVAVSASLEPAGYVPPSLSSFSPHHYFSPNEFVPPPTTLSTQYLPANRHKVTQSVFPDNQYLPPIRQSVSLPQTMYLPSRQSVIPALPSTNYLPPHPEEPSPFHNAASPFSPKSESHPALSHIYSSGDTTGYPSFGQRISSYVEPPTRSITTSIKAPSAQYLLPKYFDRSRSPHHDYKLDYYSAPAKYDFEYTVNDGYGNDYGHRESRRSDKIEGVYSVLLPDGRKQIVHYEADEHGFRPRITYKDTGLVKSETSGYGSGVNRGYESGGPY